VSAAPASPATKAPLIELFHSIQGEGRFVGAPMVFVRVATCPIRCRYCDTPHSYTAAATATVGGRAPEPNPVSAARAAELARQLLADAGAGAPPRISVTGGEPLVFPQFVRALGRQLRPLGCALHLETAALDPVALRQCIDEVDHLSADYKLPETLTAGFFGREHVQCCELAVARGRSVDVKLVLTKAVADASLARALADLLPLRQRLLLVLQPVTPFGAEPERLPPDRLLQFARAAAAAGFDYRVLPQVHRQLDVP